jgi:hypothetical protein
MLRRMPWADRTAPVSPLSAHLEWPSAEDEEAEYSEEGAPPVQRFFLGQLRGDQADAAWEDEQPGRNNGGGDRPADPTDEASDFEDFELPAWIGSPDLDQALDEDAPHLNLVATLDTEVPASATSHADDDERPFASAADDPTSIATCPVPLAGEREPGGAASERPARRLRSRIAIVAAVVALVGGTAVYVGTRAKAEDQRGRPRTSTSVERQSASTTGTTGTTAGSSDTTPDTEPAPASNAAPGSAAPASRQAAPKGTGSNQTSAPATAGSGASSPPPAASTGPDASPPPPPASPPTAAPNPICRLTPNLCP